MKIYGEVPDERFSFIVNPDGVALLRFCENPRVVAGVELADVKIYDEYTLLRQNYSGLKEKVESNIDGWAAYAKDEEIEKLSAKVRQHRDALLTATDHTQTLDAPLTTECKLAFRAYRQQLRDITARAEFPYIESWPEKPELIKAAPDPVDESIPPQVTDMQIALCEVYETVATLGGV